jgi:hypothetical protein
MSNRKGFQGLSKYINFGDPILTPPSNPIDFESRLLKNQSKTGLTAKGNQTCYKIGINGELIQGHHTWTRRNEIME